MEVSNHALSLYIYDMQYIHTNMQMYLDAGPHHGHTGT